MARRSLLWMTTKAVGVSAFVCVCVCVFVGCVCMRVCRSLRRSMVMMRKHQWTLTDRLCHFTLTELLILNQRRYIHTHIQIHTPTHTLQSGSVAGLCVSGVCPWGGGASVPSADSGISGTAASVCAADGDERRKLRRWEGDEGNPTAGQQRPKQQSSTV